jgi:hypothetical protein
MALITGAMKLSFTGKELHNLHYPSADADIGIRRLTPWEGSGGAVVPIENSPGRGNPPGLS